MKRRLFWQIYLGFVAVAALCVAATGLIAWLASDDALPRPLRGIAALIVKDLPDRANAETLRARADELGLELGLWDPNGSPIAVTNESMTPDTFEEGVTWRARGSTVMVHLPDGRWLGARGPGGRPWLVRLLLTLAVVFGVLALGAWPIARRITRRLEALQANVARWGAGDLSTRVAVRGQDEVAKLAEHFNDAAARIESLVAGQKRLLANASHELRSPLARVRMGLELIAESESAEKRHERYEAATRDVAELDALIDDLLLASRLEARAVERARGRVRLDEVARAEAERAGVRAETSAVEVEGDETLLRRLVRNLVENAVRYGRDVVVRVAARELTVEDRGPGVPEAYREAIFEPFFRLPGHAEGAHGSVGLGLALVREIAALHGADVRCVARDGGGSCFEVRFG